MSTEYIEAAASFIQQTLLRREKAPSSVSLRCVAVGGSVMPPPKTQREKTEGVASISAQNSRKMSFQIKEYISALFSSKQKESYSVAADRLLCSGFYWELRQGDNMHLT